MLDLKTLNGGVDLTGASEHLCVPFAARPLQDSRVVWLNGRWWGEQGWDIGEPDQRAAIEDALLPLFGVRSTGCRPDANDQILYADRYGGTFGAAHGGSGRCGISGRFQAKGIGRTPLAAPVALTSHADGLLPIAEAIREAVAGEIAQAELPWGAIPAVAILSTGEASGPGGAILVRPTFMRPAHFERSIYFGSAGTPGSDQQLDAFRVADLVRLADESADAFGFPGTLQMFMRFADQIGACHAHRLWQGKFLTSNAAVTGALADFGSFRSVPSWHAFFGEPEEQFGREPEYLETGFDSVVRSFERWGRPPTAMVAEDRARLRSRVIASFQSHAVAALQLQQAHETTRRRIADVLTGYFRNQQRERRQIGDVEKSPLPWLHSVLVAGQSLAAGRSERDAVDQIIAAAEADDSINVASVIDALVQWTCPRPALAYERTADLLHDIAARLAAERDGGVALLDLLIDDMLSQCWRKRPPRDGFALRGQTVSGTSRVFYGVDQETGQWLALVESTIIGDCARLFGRRIAVRDGAPPGRPRSACWAVPTTEEAILEGSEATVDGCNVQLPPARFFYPPAVFEAAAASAQARRVA